MTESIGIHDFEIIQNAEANADNIIDCVVIPLNETVIYPDIVSPIKLENQQAIDGAQYAMDEQKTAIAVAMKTTDAETLSGNDLHVYGTEIALGKVLTTYNHPKTLLVQGRRRVEILEVTQEKTYLRAKAILIFEDIVDPQELELLEHTIVSMFENLADLSDLITEEVVDFAFNYDDPIWLADFVASMMNIPFEDRQRVLATENPIERLNHIIELLAQALDKLELKADINNEIQQEMARHQREIYLREQLRAIQIELGEEDIFQQELSELREQIVKAQMPPAVEKQALKELSRLGMLSPLSPEVGVIRTYLDWLISIPWSNQSDDNLDLVRAQTVLDEEHHSLSKVKDRILEHIAVRKLAKDKMKNPIICFVGPPGVGKTSLGKSIAKALGREFVRVSLGGIRDEAEIRGHRRTYIGAMPGRIIQTMRKAGTINPVFMLDEIDKVGNDFRGDPSSALLEVLDPEQNNEFSDHYLDADYDLSSVMFITTANDLYPIPAPLLDRMEVVEFSGYTEEEKIDIATHFLIPKQLESHGLSEQNIRFQLSALQTIIRNYTYEAGVRNLNREIGNVCRKLARNLAENKKFPKRINPEHINRYLGSPQHLGLRANREDSIGLVTGLAWTANGGDILTIEVSLLEGKGNLTLTGQLGDVMQESAQTALSYVRSRAKDLNIPADDFENYDIHVHLPEGAIPKDGPSAGITLATALISVFTEAKVRSDYAMTGEITLRGKVLPIGGLKEKLLAARRNQIMNVILPNENKKDLTDIPAKVRKNMNLIFVDEMQEVMDIMLHPAPEKRQRDEDAEDNENSDNTEK